MNRFLILLKGDQQRMLKYGITYASLFTTILLIIMIQLVNAESINSFFPLLIYIDATAMSFLLIGVALIFEKQEHAIKTLLTTPINKHQYLLSKLTSTVLSSLLTLVLLGAFGIIFKDLTINYFGIIGATILISFVFGNIGILLTYKSRDFTSLLMWLVAFFLTLSVPTVIMNFGIFTANWLRYIQYLNPTQASLTLFNSTVKQVDSSDIFISLGYLLVLAVILYYYVAKLFDKYSAKELGGE